MEREFEVVKERWRTANKIQRMGICLFGVIEVLGIAWGISQSLEAYKEDKDTILGLCISTLFISTVIFFFFRKFIRRIKK